MKQTRKIACGMLIMMIVTMLCTISQAIDVYREDAEGIIQDGHFFPNTQLGNGDTWFCIQPGGEFHVSSLMTRAENELYPVGSYIPKDGSFQCETCSPIILPWKNHTKYYYKYQQGQTFSFYEYPDAAYVLADLSEKGQLLSWDAAYGIWNSRISNPQRIGDYAIIEESKAYDEFFKMIHGGYTSNDMFETLIKDNTLEIRVGVKQTDGSYVIGPFNIDYPKGVYNGENKFSWIDEMEVITNTGVLSPIIQLASGQVISIADLKENGTETLNKKDFYVKFYTTTATEAILKVTFGYLEHCEAQMTEYIGERTYRNWLREVGIERCDAHGYYSKPGSGTPNTPGYVAPSGWIDNLKEKARYRAVDEKGSESQRLMALSGQARKVRKQVTMYFPTKWGKPVDLTMKLAGNVFLDQDQGKANEGNNVFDAGEGLGGIEVTLYESNGQIATAEHTIMHSHTGSSKDGTGCYTIPVYHKHLGSESVYGECYSKLEHEHTGSKEYGTGCYRLVYHKHTADCNGDPQNPCKISTIIPEGYEIVCGNQEKYIKTCTKDENTIDYYAPGCNKTVGQSDGTRTQLAKTLTDENGHYEFDKLNAQKTYYVEYVYNGMLYTNVERLAGNATNVSKATEEAQGHTGNRQSFNNQFKEIGSNPKNYYSASRGAYNQVFLQEEIADTFKTIAKNYGNHSGSDKEVFAYDCRIKAYSTESYPLTKIFTIDDHGNVLAGENFDAIYEAGGPYDQLHINLGIKARPTFDLALYKDVMKATLNINGQTEVYTYDARKDWENKGFSYGVKEDYYLNALRDKYINNKDTGDLQRAEEGRQDQYSHEYRTEEIINGNNLNETYRNDWLGKDEYKAVLYGEENKDKNYSWRDINSNLKDSDKLQIHITYKIAIRNQSNITGSVTEVVDYYDEHYQFESAYMGDKDGNEIPNTKVEASEKSMYGEENEIRADRNNADKSWTVGQTKRGYKTIYLRPTEKILYSDDKEQYIYVTFGLINPEQTLINAGLPWGNTFYTYNLAEINGYKTYIAENEYKENKEYYDNNRKVLEETSLGLIDRDSNPGNFNPSEYNMGITKLEDDTSKAPAYAYSIRKSRTIEGTVFEDGNEGSATSEEHKVDVAKTRFGNGKLGDKNDKGIAGVKAELIEIKDNQLIVRSTTYTDEKGWYGFGAFIPGDYTIRFTYGADDQTALTKESQYIDEYITKYNETFENNNAKIKFKQRYGLDYGIKNDTSYTGQDYKSTEFALNQGQTTVPHEYKTDATLIGIYDTNNKAKNSDEQEVAVAQTQKIIKYEADGYYWFADAAMAGRSDATDDLTRRDQVTKYAKEEYDREIVNHKAEVFNSFINQKTLRQKESENNGFDEYTQAQPTEEIVDTMEKNRSLVNELERRNYMYAYTPEIKIEFENTKKQIEGNLNVTKPEGDKDYYEYEVRGIDFGVVEKTRSQLTIDQDIAHVKVIATDGTVLLELAHEEQGNNFKVIVNNGDNYMYMPRSDFAKYDKQEQLNIIMDDELLSGAKLEVTYRITVTNNSEQGVEARAKNIINYVANNLNFDLNDNNGLWEAVKKEEIQTDLHSSFIHNGSGENNTKLVDLSTQTTVLKATSQNPLTKMLAPKESVTSTLTLKKTLSAESTMDDLSYSNLSEIIEIESTDGRYDRGAIPGNQSLEEQPREHDTLGASRYDEIDEQAGTKQVKTRYPQDGLIIITPPTGETRLYYVLGAVIGVILLIGIVAIKKFVTNRKEQ